MSKYIFCYLIIVNLLGLIICFYDKKASRSKGKMRVPESTLFTIAIVGGSIGFWTGMQLFRHKTRHCYFVWGIPIIIIVQVILFVMIRY